MKINGKEECNMDTMIRINQMSKSYNGKIAVDNLNFELEKGQTMGILGANGAGKSTSIECILGTKKMDKGEIRILGMNPAKDRKKLFQRVGVQFQEGNYQTEIRVDELCEETASLYRDPADWKFLLDKFGIREKENSLIKDLSGGQRQRLFIILAFMPKPDAVFLDELTTGLDARARRDAWKILKSLKEEGITMVLTSHFMDEVEELCDYILVLKKSRTVFKGTVKEAVAASPYDKFEDAYLWLTDDSKEGV